MASVKIVVTGPFGVGKTTLIRTISEITVLSTERDISDHTKVHKERTTVAMDFGRITIDPTLVLYLFGTPGQERFDFMWEILAEGMLGFVLVCDRSREDTFEDAEKILKAFKSYGSPVPYVIAVNKYNPADPAGEISYVQDRLALDDGVPVIPVNALDRGSVKNVLLALLYSVLEQVESDPVAASA
jgi:small GTP-binding protein